MNTPKIVRVIGLLCSASIYPGLARADPTVRIDAIQQAGGWGNTASFILTGQFDAPIQQCWQGPSMYPLVDCYQVDAYCNGALEPAIIERRLATELDVRIVQRPSGFASGTGSRCAFFVTLHHGDGITSVRGAGNVNPPPIEIHGVIDRGVTDGQHNFELYGYFPVGAYYYPDVNCDGGAIVASVTTPNNPSMVLDQINIAFPKFNNLSKSCVFTIFRFDDFVSSPPWYQRVDGPKTGSSALSSYWGAYHWGGFEPDLLNRRNALPVSLQRLHDAGITGPIRFSLNPQEASYFPSEFYDWYDDFFEWNSQGTAIGAEVLSGPGQPCAGVDGLDKFLARSVCTRRFQAALNEVSAGSTVILTTMDETSLNSSNASPSGPIPGYISLPFMNGHHDDVMHEYEHLAAALFKSQAGTGKKFIVSNWESESMVYGSCGGPFVFVQHVRDHGEIPAACLGYTDRIRAQRLWFQARKDGIDKARADNPGAGVTVVDAIEMAGYRMVDGQGRLQGCSVGADGLGSEGCLRNADTLHGIVPYALPTYVLYSAWETANAGLVGQDLWEIALYLYSLNPPNPPRFGLGEFGRPGQASRPLDSWIFRENISSVRRIIDRTGAPNGGSPLEFAVIWQAFPTVDEEEALLTVEGAETDAMRMLTTGSKSYAPGLPGGAGYVISAVREIPEPAAPAPYCPIPGTRTDHQRTFELYGTFPPNPRVLGKCSGGSRGIHDTYLPMAIVGSPSHLQVDITVDELVDRGGHPVYEDIWCVFVIADASGVTGPAFGPIRSYAEGPCNPVTP